MKVRISQQNEIKMLSYFVCVAFFSILVQVLTHLDKTPWRGSKVPSTSKLYDSVKKW